MTEVTQDPRPPVVGGDGSEGWKKVVKILTGPILTPYQKRRTAHLWKLFPRMPKVLPQGQSGDVEIQHFKVDDTKARIERLRKNELWTPGVYCQLNIGGVGWMYDVLHERAMNERPVREARGDVLIGGLGLGMILWPILLKPEVTSVTVLENSEDVAQLVLPSLKHHTHRDKLRLVMADAKTWEPAPGQQFDAIWLDCVPCYGYGHKVLEMHDSWLERYRPFLRDPHGYLDHWGYHENLQWMINQASATRSKRSRFLIPLGPPDPAVKTFLDKYPSMATSLDAAEAIARFKL